MVHNNHRRDESLVKLYDNITEVLKEISSDNDVVEMLSSSCLVAQLSTHLGIDSMLDVDRSPGPYIAALTLVKALSDDEVLRGFGYRSPCVYTQVQALSEKASATQNVMLMLADPTNGQDQCVDTILALTSEILKQAPAPVPVTNSKLDENPNASSNRDELSLSPEDAAAYVSSLSSNRFMFVTKFDTHHYSKKFAMMGNAPTKLIRHLSREYAALATSLPTSEHSSIFVRASDMDIRLARVLITGPPNTPYSNGAFVFDVAFPNEYPQVPPLMNLVTTGGGCVRFNPNL